MKRGAKFKMSKKGTRELYKERNQRVMNAISLKEPDRVPLTPLAHFYPMIQKGMTKSEAMYDSTKSAQAAIEIYSKLNVDQAISLAQINNGPLMDALGIKYFKWPGAADEEQNLSTNQPFQFVEGEYMKADEYEEFIADPTGFAIRKLIPRHFSKLSFFSEFPDIGSLTDGFLSVFTIPLFLSSPAALKIIESIQEIKETFSNYIGDMRFYENELKKMGFPLQFVNYTQAPFDLVSDFLRGMKGSMLDMYRKPEELKKLLDLLTQPAIDVTTEIAKLFPRYKVVFIALHRGADGFMSLRQFEEFYWPTLTKLMDGLIEKGLIPMPHFQGKYTDRFPYLKEYAKKNKGKLIYRFGQSDIIKAKELFGDSVCLRGNIPSSLLNVGTPQQVEIYVKKSIEGCMEGGGYLIDADAGIPDEAKAENVKAMTDAVFKYGWYRK
jgi:uroporphyrinogen-III decarboxylase